MNTKEKIEKLIEETKSYSKDENFYTIPMFLKS